jgi:hypothetical protein
MTNSRVIFADEIQPGTVILERCSGRMCTRPATNHHEDRPHEFTVLRRRISEGVVNAIVLDEDGEQQPWGMSGNITVRVRLGTLETHKTEQGPVVT